MTEDVIRIPRSEPGSVNQFEVCPVAQPFDEIGSKWRLIVLHHLVMNGERRFDELQERTPADSSTLTRVLEELEERDLIRRRLEDRPIATYYDPTDEGESLATTFDDIEDWADNRTAADSKSELLPLREQSPVRTYCW